MKKICIALMLCFVSITCFAAFSTKYVFGALKSDGDYIPKSFNYEDFKSVDWVLLWDHEKIVLTMGDDQMIFMITRVPDDTQKGVRVMYATEALTASDVKLYFYLNEGATKYFKDEGKDIPIYELDINDYMSRTCISVLLIDVE